MDKKNRSKVVFGFAFLLSTLVLSPLLAHMNDAVAVDPCEGKVIEPIMGTKVRTTIDTTCNADPLNDVYSAYIVVDSADGCLDRVSICNYDLLDNGCDDPAIFKVYTITWCAFYKSGTQLSFEQTIRIARPNFDMIACPPDTSVYCLSSTDPSITGEPTVDGHGLGEFLQNSHTLRRLGGE